MKMKIAVFAALMSFSGLAMAHGDSTSRGPRLCARYQCLVGLPPEYEEGGYPDVPGPFLHSTTGYGDTVEAAGQDGMPGCLNQGGGSACQVLECEKYHGPQIPIFSSCQDQWTTNN